MDGWPPYGITRLLGRREFHPQDCSRSFRTTLEEYHAFTNISPAQVRATGNLGELPLIVIAHDPAAEIALEPSAQVRQDEAIDLQMQRELSELSNAWLSAHCGGESALYPRLKARPGTEEFGEARPRAHLVHNVRESPYIRLCDF